MKTNDQILDTLLQLKQEQNLSISEIARRTGMVKATISRYFNRKRQIPLNSIEAFAKAFGVNANYLIGLEDQPKHSIEHLFNQLNPSNQETLIKHAMFLLNEQGVPYTKE